VTVTTDLVDVEWALQGKTLGRAGARVLACSSGSLSMDNFTELIGRFSLGTPDDLPQVSVSYLTYGTAPSRTHYLGMAIHDWAANVRTDGEKLLERDDDNRPVVATTYFCLPYQPLEDQASKDAAISYQDMYHQLSNVRLATTSGPPLQVTFPTRVGLPAISPLAVQTASRLFGGRRVCVLDARPTTVAERLEFTDAVATLIPYGFRTRLAAATWVRPTHRDHRFRLSFSAAKRDADPPDDVVYWGRPEVTELTPDDDIVYTYRRWLEASLVQPFGTLAQLTKPRSFKSAEVLQSLNEIGVHRPRGQGRRPAEQKPPDQRPPDQRPPDQKPVNAEPPYERSPYSREPEEPVTRVMERPPAPGDHLFTCEQLLRECAGYLRPVNVPDLTVAVMRLQPLVRQGISSEDRERCRELIREHYLFRHAEDLGALEGQLRDVLFKIAFDPPLTYQDYCLIEDSIGDEYLDLRLLQKIGGATMSDVRIEAVVCGQLFAWGEQPRLDDWHESRQMTSTDLIVGLIDALAGSWGRPRHVLYASLAVSQYVMQVPSDSLLVREALRRHGYLARLLQTVAGDQNQVSVLTRILRAAYPGELGRDDIWQILFENPDLPTQALLVAVLFQPAPWENQNLAREAREAYVTRTTLAMDLDDEARTALQPRLAPAPRTRADQG
jgi:hypothetical protein